MTIETQGAATDAAAQGAAAAAGAPGTGAAAAATTTTTTTQPNTAGQKEASAGTVAAGAQDGAKAGEGAQGAKDDKSAVAAAPFVPKLPDGEKIDDASLKKLGGIFADEKLTPNERMQKLVDLDVERRGAMQRAFQDRLAAQPAQDLEALKTDKDFGGPNFEKTVKGAERSVQQFFGEAWAKKLSALGMQNDPDFIRGCARIARAIAEDSVAGKGKAGAQVNTEEARLRKMFPNSYDQMAQTQNR